MHTIILTYTFIIFASVTAFLLFLKALEMGYQCYIIVSATTVQHLTASNWPITNIFNKIHLDNLFRFPILIIIMSFLLASDTLPYWLTIIGSVLIACTIWVQVVQALVSRLKFGFCDIFFRRISITGDNTPRVTKVTQQQNTRYLVLFFVFLIITVTVGYAGVYLTLCNINPCSFTGSIHGMVDCFYFSVVTFATVGYGDISPASTLARLTTVSEIFVSMSCVVLLILAYSMTSNDDACA